MKRFITLKEYALKEGISYNAALVRIRRGYLPSKKLYGKIHVDMHELNKMLGAEE